MSGREVSSPTGPSCGLRVVVIHEPDDDSDSSANEASSEEENDTWKKPTKSADLPSEYWHIQKLVKYMKVFFNL